METHDVGLYMGDAACPPRAAKGELENGDAPNGDWAVWNGDCGMNGDVGEYDGDLQRKKKKIGLVGMGQVSVAPDEMLTDEGE